MFWILATVALAAVTTTPPPAAPCPDQVCASEIPSVVRALQQAGYKAELKIGKSGSPYVASGANGSEFTINFLSCDDDKKKVGCKTLLLQTWYSAKPYLTEKLANDFNKEALFGRAYLDDKRDLMLEVTVTTAGGISQVNFNDVVEWWAASDSDLDKLVGKAIDATKSSAGKSA